MSQGNDIRDLSITISSDQSTFKAGSNIYVHATMKNTSAHEVDCSSYYVGGMDRRFRVTVKDAQGHSMIKPDVLPAQLPGSLAFCSLAPGETAVHDLLINQFFDLNRPGNYTVQVSRVVSNDEINGLAQSNTLTFSLTP
jgi:hypothetical protein